MQKKYSVYQIELVYSTRLRSSSHKLVTETGRWSCIPRVDRLCPCGVIQTEQHAICHYPLTLYRLPNCESMISCFYYVVQSSLDYYLPIITVNKWSTDKPWVTPKFHELVTSRQKAFLSGDLARYHRLRNSTQRLAAKLRKNYFNSNCGTVALM